MSQTLHVDTGREMRGGQWQALYLVERLPEPILLAPENAPLFQEAKKRKLDVRPLSFVRLVKLARQVMLTHAHDARAHTLAAMAGAAPLIVSRRVGFPVNRSLASRWKYSRAAMYLAVSQFVAGRLTEAGVPAQRIRVIYDGVPLPPLSNPSPGRVVALVSKPAEAPGIPIYLTTNLWHDLATASVFVYMSEMEGLGSATLAAMAAGVPVIASRVGGLPEAVEHERTGLLIGPSDLASALRRLLDDPVSAAEMGRRARERVQEKFTVETMAAATLRAYKEVAK
jgi:glycosyltransferase involved in cell wall biosynthesis